MFVSYIHMKKIIMQNDNVLCRLKDGPHKETSSGFIYETNDVPTYEVINIGPNVLNNIDLKIGDIVRTNSTGTIINIDNEDLYIFKAENIMGKIIV